MDDGSPQRRLAQLNVARLAHPLGDPRLADFMSNLARVNAIAERSPGFVWRLTDEIGEDATGLTVDPGDPRVLPNLSVWESAESFENFVWNTLHRRFYNRRAEWFEPPRRAHFVMWWIPVGHRPGLAEGLARLERLRAEGTSPEAFGWEGLPHLSAWRARRCA